MSNFIVVEFWASSENCGSGAKIDQHPYCPAGADAAEKYDSVPCWL